MSTGRDQLQEKAIEAFDRFVASQKGFSPRPGQREMAAEVARLFSAAALNAENSDTNAPHPVNVSVIQAGTGVGKSVAYSVPAIWLALERKTKVIISTGTVALQEQLAHKDLPTVAATLGRDFKVAIAKGRGRYLCTQKLRRQTGEMSHEEALLFEDMDATEPTADSEKPHEPSKSRKRMPEERTLTFYKDIKHRYESGRWDGDRDSLDQTPSASAWSDVAADRHTCTSRKCPDYQSCSYFRARRSLNEADVIVVNHDLLLASMDTRLLPDLKNSFLVLDEAHNLPDVAIGQFTAELDLTRTQWVDQLAKRLRVAGAALGKAHLTTSLEPQLAFLKTHLKDLQRMARDCFDPTQDLSEQSRTFDRGDLPAAMEEPLRQVQHLGNAVAGVMRELSSDLVEKLKESSPSDGPGQWNQLYASLGTAAPRVNALLSACVRLLADKGDPHAKWASVSDGGGHLQLTLHACPLNADQNNLLSKHFWPCVGSAVATSATLTSCGRFDFFLQESGLAHLPADTVRTLKVESPFDYPRQGELIVVQTESTPKDAPRFEKETMGELLNDLGTVTSGALVLFASNRHMKQALESLPAEIRSHVLVQGTMSRSSLLKKHRDAVDAGKASVIFGLQSFGEGLDLPGRYCETLVIAKLPFAPPTDPVAKARALWLQDQKRSAFDELVIPAAGMRMAQWTGRAIRTETDIARVICYDARLITTSYGRTILRGLPPMRRLERIAGVCTSI